VSQIFLNFGAVDHLEGGARPSVELAPGALSSFLYPKYPTTHPYRFIPIGSAPVANGSRLSMRNGVTRTLRADGDRS
jgi:hypothetical protein